MENTKENKGKFFAQYFGQKVLCSGSNDVIFEVIGMDLKDDLNESDYLQLTPLSQITDEDAIEVAEIINISNYDIIETFNSNDKNVLKGIITSKKDGDNYGGIVYLYSDYTIYWDYYNKEKYNGYETRILESYDYLRSKSYALPYMGLSVEQLQSLGWIRLSK